MKKAKVSAFSISIVITILFVLSHIAIELLNESGGFTNKLLSKNGLLYRLELSALDTKFQMRPKVHFEPKVAVAKIDEKSLERYGLWPWNRTVMADLVESLIDANVKVIGFDMIFTDEAKDSTFKDIKQFKEQFDAFNPVSSSELSVQSSLKKAQSDLSQLIKVKEQNLNTLNKKCGDKNKNSDSYCSELAQINNTLRSLDDYHIQALEYQAKLKNRIDAISPDLRFAQALAKNKKTVMGFFVFRNESELSGLTQEQLQEKLSSVESYSLKNVYKNQTLDNGMSVLKAYEIKDIAEKLYVPKAVAVQTPLPILLKNSSHLGLFNIIPDIDGHLRKVPMLFRVNNSLFPALTLQMAQIANQGEIQPMLADYFDSALVGISVADDKNEKNTFTIPTDANGELYINYYGDPEAIFPSFSIVDIIDKKVDPKLLKDKAVFIGATAIGSFDLRTTPFSVASPGVYVHVSALQNIFDHNFLNRFYGIALFEGLFLLILGIALGLILPRVRVTTSLFLVVGFLALLGVLDIFLIFPSGYWVRSVSPILQTSSIFVAITIYRYMTEEREKRHIRKAFQFYLTKSVVDQMLEDTSALKLGGEKKELSVLFSDIRSFTTISEKLDPEVLVQLLNSYLTPMTDIVFKYEGTLDKYMGDAIMAIFGAPLAQPDHALRTCHCAIDMIEKLRTLQPQWQQKGLPKIEIGIGVNSGTMAIGNMGSEMRFDYTVMGDNVNLGSRLEGLTKEYGIEIIISQSTYDKVKDHVYVRELDWVKVKGKNEPVTIYELRGRNKAPKDEQDFLDLFRNALTLYRQQKFEQAIELFKQAIAQNQHDKCSKIYIDRCETMKANPPDKDWDGVFKMTVK